jgi:GrpB-like predicted nucleotidyltransferase (UPF0157 family)
MADAPVLVVPYDDTWPQQFEAERQRLAQALGLWLVGEVQHIGSTAVPGLAAKPVIDIMAPVHSLQDSQPAIAAATRLGWLHHPYRPEVMHWFCKPSAAHRTHHLHLVPFGSTLWHQRLDFRDALRRHPALAAEYAALKLSLAERFRHDRDAYTEAKTPFVLRVLTQDGLARHDAEQR